MSIVGSGFWQTCRRILERKCATAVSEVLGGWTPAVGPLSVVEYGTRSKVPRFVAVFYDVFFTMRNTRNRLIAFRAGKPRNARCVFGVGLQRLV